MFERYETLYSLAVKKSVDIDARTVTAWASKAVIDRDNELILGAAWQHPDSTADFERNPVLLVGHDYKSLPVGRVIRLDKSSAGLKITAQYAKTAAAEEAFGVIRDLGLAAYSVGFFPKSHKLAKLADLEKAGYDTRGVTVDPIKVYDHVQLLEISHVAIPSNPRATALGAAAMDGRLKSKSLREALGPWLEKVDGVSKDKILEILKTTDLKVLMDESIGRALLDLRAKVQVKPRELKPKAAPLSLEAMTPAQIEEFRRAIREAIREAIKIGIAKYRGRVF